MNQKFKQLEKLIKKIFIPKINNIFSNYGKLKITGVEVGESNEIKRIYNFDTDGWKSLQKVPVKIYFDIDVDQIGYIPTIIGYFIANLVKYVFIESVYLEIQNVFNSELDGEGSYRIGTDYDLTSTYISDSEIEKLLTQELGRIYN